ncbi:MAG: hypothetical protein FWB85_01225 [Chitinispirillia bacterium]|nr:hypothetical protein [Chitinispirillia bacterium]
MPSALNNVLDTPAPNSTPSHLLAATFVPFRRTVLVADVPHKLSNAVSVPCITALVVGCKYVTRITLPVRAAVYGIQCPKPRTPERVTRYTAVSPFLLSHAASSFTDVSLHDTTPAST